jgi:hypothetical protein
MNKLITLLIVLFISIGCTSDKKKITAALETEKIKETKISKDFTTIKDTEYTLHFEIENTNIQKPILVISIELHNGSYFVSPHAKRDFKGKFYMDLGSYTHLDFEGDIIETPRSVEEIDEHPFVNGTINWVRENTTYKQQLNIKSEEDFEVYGRVRFTIEPRCTLEEIPFIISYKNGVITFIEPKC